MRRVINKEVTKEDFKAVLTGAKTCEVCKGCSIQIGDYLVFKECNYDLSHTGRETMVEVSTVLTGVEGLQEGYCVVGWIYDKADYESLQELLEEDTVIFSNPSYKTALIGVSSDGQAVYDYNKMVDFLVANGDDITEGEAIEFVDYNTIRSLPYMGEKHPIVMYN